VLKNVYISPNEAFVKGSFSLAAIDFFDGCCFYFAVGVENVDDVAADDGDRMFWIMAGVSDGKVIVFHDRSLVFYL